ncbi:hypothetical protein E2C01_098421 [Portunus trituberculatus]|uniref:Uncharacterized protein n=1 Tax=Portunus trituberculatus TaxID=210409 RepID=A0A5B7K7L6_PORTR|nr:hypothetical protein [Portunus trituberculatus]
MALIITTLYSITFETLNGFIIDQGVAIILVRFSLHISIHLIGAHIMIMTQDLLPFITHTKFQYFWDILA